VSSAVAVQVRKAREDDLDTIQRIYNDEILTGVATWDEEPWSMERRQAWFKEHGDLTPVLVAEEGGKVAGFAYLTLMSQKRGYRFAREDTIYIDPAFQGRGIGKVLLEALLDEARRIGVRLVFASIEATNMTSIALHERFGFRVVGTLENAGFKFGAWRSTTYMQLDLGEPAKDAATWP
jgi:phosphinothricin acetyltransferase